MASGESATLIGLERFAGRRVLVTGDTGFKGAWLASWLDDLGAEVHGASLPPSHARNLFSILRLRDRVEHADLDLRDRDGVAKCVERVQPAFVFHLAAQAIVRRSYRAPLETIDTNVIGTANLLSAIRDLESPCQVVVVTSDKCYERPESGRRFVEDDPLGGYDPYSASKGMVEVLVRSWRRSFHGDGDSVRIATCRAGNVIGGGDRAEDRIVVDAVRALANGTSIRVRNPAARRPWQHVLDPLSGYLRVALALEDDPAHATAWNFGPHADSERTVAELCDAIVSSWGSGRWDHDAPVDAPHEAPCLHLSSERATSRLGWRPSWAFDEAVKRTVAWYRAAEECADHPDAMLALTREQVRAHGPAATAGSRS